MGEFRRVAGYWRRSSGGKETFVEPHWRWYPEQHQRRNSLRTSKCPSCGASIDVKLMSNRRKVVFDAGLSRQNSKHHCFYVGEKIATGAELDMGDLFDGKETGSKPGPKCG